MLIDPPRGRSSQKEYHVPALEKGLAILEHLVASGAKNLNQIREELSISQTTAFSLLKNMMQLGYLECDANGLYRPTLKLFSLGMQVQREMPYEAKLMPELIAQRDEMKNTIHLASYVGNHSVLLYKLQGPGGVQFLSYVGEMKPLHLSGGGKAMLAYCSETQFQAYISGPLEKRTEKTICTAQALAECRQSIRRQSYALDDEEGELGVFCIGVPLFASGGVIFGGLSVSMIKSLYDSAAYESYVSKMLLAGERLSRLLGYTGPYPLTDA